MAARSAREGPAARRQAGRDPPRRSERCGSAARGRGFRQRGAPAAPVDLLRRRVRRDQPPLPVPPAHPLRHAVVADGLPAAQRPGGPLRAGADAAHRLPGDRERERDDPRRHAHPRGAGRQGRTGPPQHRRSVRLHARLRRRRRRGDHSGSHRRRRAGGTLRCAADPGAQRGRRSAGAVSRHEAPGRRAAGRDAGAASGADVAVRERHRLLRDGPAPPAREGPHVAVRDRCNRQRPDPGRTGRPAAPLRLLPAGGVPGERPLRADRGPEADARRDRRQPP